MIDGRWHDRWYDTTASAGRFVRSESQFRNWVTPAGEPGPTGAGGFKAEPGRYHTTQAAYDEVVRPLFATLDRLDALLGKQPYLCGSRITEADWRLFTTLVRFDLVYVGHFKCNIRRISDYPNLWAYTRELYQWPGVRATVNFEHIKRHYYESHASINPTRIVPAGPLVEFENP